MTHISPRLLEPALRFLLHRGTPVPTRTLNGNYNPSAPTGVETPADDPNVIGVGGTSLFVNSNGVVSGETAWSLGSEGATGGGQSIVFSRPSWQGSIPINSSGRLVPDLAVDGDPNTGVFLVLNGSTSSAFGGTSLGPPILAGICARINQVRASNGVPPLGLLGPKIYPLFGSSAFRDIIGGTNGAYFAGQGFDLLTGMGAPNANVLTSALAGVPIDGSGVAKDFNNTGFADLVWENTVTGQHSIWFMQNGVLASWIALPTLPTQWRIAGVGDFNGDGYADLVWENSATGEHSIWLMQNGVLASWIALPIFPTQWHVAGAGDFTGSGSSRSRVGEYSHWSAFYLGHAKRRPGLLDYSSHPSDAVAHCRRWRLQWRWLC
jgi:FG-GAP-like repeat